MTKESLSASAKRLFGPLVREIQLYPAVFRRGARPRVAFLTYNPKVQSGLLRATNIARGLDGHGWASIVVPANLSLRQRNRVLHYFRPDVVVLQKCRHPLNRAEYLKNWPIVLDLDDADFVNPKASSVLQEVATQARAVMAGSGFIRDWAARFNQNVSVVWTGTPFSKVPRPDHQERKPIVTWAQADPLGYPDEMQFCRDVLLKVVSRIGPVDFRLYRCVGQEDHPILKELASAGVRLQLLPHLRYEEFLASLQEVAIGLSPLAGHGFSLGKSFGKILGYIDAHVPVICSDRADHSQFFDSSSGVVSNDSDVWADAICKLIADPIARNRMAEAAHNAALSQLSLEAVTLQVHLILSRVLRENRDDRIAGVSEDQGNLH